MKKTIAILLLWVLAVCTGAQAQLKKASPAQSKAMIARINRAAASIKTATCTFVQTKTMSFLNDKMVSRGHMYYTSAGQLRWEYTSPYSYIFVVNNGRVTMKSGKRTTQVNASSSSVFQSIARIMMSSVTGKSLSNNRDFKVGMYLDGGNYVAQLTPKTGKMKKMFKLISLHFNAARSMVSRVVMTERNGDNTIIDLKHVKTNSYINGSVFTVR